MIIQRTLKDWIIQYDDTCHADIPPSLFAKPRFHVYVDSQPTWNRFILHVNLFFKTKTARSISSFKMWPLKQFKSLSSNIIDSLKKNTCTVRAVTRVINAGKVLSMLAGLSAANQNEIWACNVHVYKTPENGVLLKECRCVYAFQVNYGKPSDCNKMIRRYFNESFYF